MIILTYGALTGLLLVPPVGLDCRHFGELLIALAWGVSACVNNLQSDNEVLATKTRRKRVRFVLWKDIFVTIATMGGIIFTQIDDDKSNLPG